MICKFFLTLPCSLPYIEVVLARSFEIFLTVLGLGHSRMDVPVEPLFDVSPVRPAGRGHSLISQSVANHVVMDPASPMGSLAKPPTEPMFRVKRWRKDPPTNFVQPSPKACATTPRQTLNRWDQGVLSSQYRPPSLHIGALGGLAPPSIRKRELPPPTSTCAGFHYSQPAKLQCHSRAFQAQLAVQPPQGGVSEHHNKPWLPQAEFSLSAPLDLPNCVAKLGPSDTTTMLALHQQLKEQHHIEWLRILEVAGDASDLVKTTRNSANVMAHRARVIAKFSPSTLASYFRCWFQWVDFCKCHDTDPHQPPLVLLADFLQVSSRGSALGVATAHSRALTWMAKYAGFPSLKQALDAPITRAYTIPSEVVPRKEAAPLPLSFVVYLETCILKDLGTPADHLIMGSILVLVWASLRWSDALWVTPGDDSDIIRGVANKTKTTSRGMPFALVKSGLLGINASVSWSTKWLNLVRQALQRTSEVFPGFTPDFLLPQCSPNPEHPLFSAPLSRSHGVLMLRNLPKQSHKEASVLSIGVHSPKVTLLSWARQVGASEDLRMAQGHHRQAGAKSNVALYGRDDVHPAIQLQKLLLHKISSGFRPVIPLLRGGAKPITDRPVHLPGSIDAAQGSESTPLCLPEAADLLDTDSDDSDGDRRDGSLGDASVPMVKMGSTDCIFLLNMSSNVAHVAAGCDASDPCCVVSTDDGFSQKSFKFACNVRRSVWDKEIVPAETFPAQFRLCMRPACAKIFD